MPTARKRNILLCREIYEIINTCEIPIWITADIFDLNPDNLSKLYNGEITPTIYQLIMFMDTVKKTLNNIHINDYLEK